VFNAFTGLHVFSACGNVPVASYLRLYQVAAGQRPWVAVLTAASGRDGGALACSLAEARRSVCELFGLDPDCVVLVRHTPASADPALASHPAGRDRYAVVEFGTTADGRTVPVREIDRAPDRVEAMAGRPLDAVPARFLDGP
jgi:hypothetical protein